MDINVGNDSITFCGVNCFDLTKSCSCGQAFRWRPYADGMLGVVYGKPMYAAQFADKIIVRAASIAPSDAALCAHYFDLGRDYASIESQAASDPKLAVCFPAACGIRVFNQEPFEALISFIISQNNNIKRISGIIERLCALCGSPIDFLGETLYSFPTPQSIAALTIEQLTDIESGYRAPFIVSAAQRICDGYELDALRDFSLDDARKELLSFYGVGPKVADCVLLFSLGHTDAFPIDVWIDRAVRALYFDGGEAKKQELVQAASRLGEYSGILQQYIFQYARQVGKSGLA